MGPPTDIPARELFLKLLERPRPSDVIDFPRKDKNGNPVSKIRIQVLPMEKHDEARLLGQAVADKKLRARGVEKDSNDPVVREIVGDAIARELLALACVSVEPVKGSEDQYGRLFMDGAELDKMLTADEIAVLFRAYTLIQYRYGPFEKTIETEADLNAWVKRLAEGGSELNFLALSLPQQANVNFSLVERVFMLSALLECLYSSLPESCRSLLSRYNIGTGFYGSPQIASMISQERLPEWSIEDVARIEETVRATGL